MTRIMSLVSSGGSVELGRSSGVRALASMRGTGLPPVQVQWFEGAGDGAQYRGARVLPRVLDLTLKVEAAGREVVRQRLGLLGRIFAPTASAVRLTVDLDAESWFVDVRRMGGGDFGWADDTDGASFLKTTLTLQAGDPYWTRVREDQRVIMPGGLGRGMLGGDHSLSQLRLSTTTSLGSTTLPNSGDVEVYPVWTIRAPFTGFALTSQRGETLAWGTAGNGVSGASKTSGFIVVDMTLGTVVDELGVNRYDGLAVNPRFWAVSPGAEVVSVVLPGAVDDSTVVEVLSQPRAWVMF
jgi:hypothetical protein